MSIHPNYTGLNDNFQNDICLLHLDESFTLGPMMNEISVLKNESQFEGIKCTISGWGTKQVSQLKYKNDFVFQYLIYLPYYVKNTEFLHHQESGGTSTVLQYAEVEILDNDVCNLSYNTVTGKKLFYAENMICAGLEKVISNKSQSIINNLQLD